MDKSSLNESPFPKLSLDEVLELERLYQDMGEKSLDRKFFQEIAKHFSSSSNCAAKTPLSWQQVQQWFKNKEKESQDNLSDSCNLENGHKSTSSSKVKPDVDLSDLAFEARSSKDFAWHDIAMFLNHRVMSTGELEREDYALYCDAHVVKIERRIHDPTECRCSFIVRYIHDNTEEVVRWNRLCCRPTQEESVVFPTPTCNPILNPIESLWG
ncbi:protein SAWADEE HOMEODOMAIN HOMOLOG 1-like isoform X3 [Abrus precatorius]|uniref:Protein SAWADEE HOMEODOMAIN HOMOLOG 1-like isoform X3 n=1 Tax=Abrus precatorius TaxID=3816 RepID=A0A8B8K135_ABRPR|nr:protein SAWADEE HOMEODOMAIN HOMOLOG 1-like isoform X3 [Abrus precatorius]